MLNSFFKYASGRWSNTIVSSSDPLPVEIIGGGYDLSTLIVEDSLGTKFIRRELINTEGIVTIVYEDFDGLSAVPVAPITIASTVLPVGASTSAKQDELQGSQGTGSSYDPPTGGSGAFGWLSGTYKEIVSGIKLKFGGTDVSASNPLPVSGGNFTYTKDNTGTTPLTASWALVKTTTSETKALRMSAACDASSYDIEYTFVEAEASAPTDAHGQALLAGDDFVAGIPIGDIYARSASSQKLIVWSA